MTRWTPVACLVLAGCAPRATTGTDGVPLDRGVIPAAGPTPTYDFPDIERHTLSNGLGVWLVERRGIPLVTVQLIVDAGAVADPPGEHGLASLTAAMLMEGTSRRSATEIATELDFLAVSMNASAGREVTTVSMGTLSRNLPAALDIFADVVIRPAFNESDWARVREQRLVSLIQTLDQPATIATQEFSRTVFGGEHPLGRPLQGTPESVRATSTAALHDFHRGHYTPANSNLVVVGDVEKSALFAELESAFAEWREVRHPAAVPYSAPPPQGATRIFIYDKPGAAQSEIRIGHVGLPRDHADYLPVLVLNTILGGQFSSRINLNLREDKGYTYGARSSFQTGRMAGPFVAQAGVQTAVTRESVIEFMRELEEIRGSRPVTPEELDFALASIIRREPLTLETNQQIASRIQELVVYALPLDYFDHYNSRIAAVTLEDVNRVARAHIHPDRFAIVVVGDLATIEPALRALPYPVEVIAAESPL